MVQCGFTSTETTRMSSWHIRDKLSPVRVHGSVWLYVHRNHKDVQLTYQGQTVTSACAWFSVALRPQKPQGCPVDISGTNCHQCVCMVQCGFTSTETTRMSSWHIRDKLSPVRVHGSVWLYVHTKPQGCPVDISGTNCHQCVCMVQCGFTSTETTRLVRTGSRGGHLGFHTPPELWKLAGLNTLFLYEL